jgi:hypothetical protein
MLEVMSIGVLQSLYITNEQDNEIKGGRRNDERSIRESERRQTPSVLTRL